MKILLAVVAVGCAWAQTPDIADIMSRVARNQAKSQDLRKAYVYNQKQLLRLVRGNGKIAREEHREYTIMPQDRGIKKELTSFDGKYLAGKKYVSYDHPGYEYKNVDIDGSLIDSLSKDLTDSKDSKDGISRDLFPLTYHQQLKYKFRLLKTEQYRGRDVFRVAFEPDRDRHSEDDDAIWKGEALIDAEEYQPIVVHTNLALHIPAAVKVLLGTNIKGLGFSVSYQKFEDGLWFPVSYGGEFEVRAVFFYKRNISISLVNSDFKRSEVTSNVAYVIEDK